MTENRTSHRLAKPTVWAAVIFVIAVGCRLVAARGELSFDEIWSWHLAAQSSGVIEILVLRLDNNHILNTLAMYALGPQAEPFTYRLPAVIAASAGLAFGYLLARRWGAGLPVLILLGASHVLILYGSEARGYAYLTGCTLGAWWLLEEFLDQPRLWCRAGFALACALGFFSQLPFAFAYAGFGVYSVLRLYRQRQWIMRLVLLHAWPLVAIVAVYFFYVDGLIKGGGDKFSLSRTLVAALSLMAGGPQLPIGAFVGGGAAVLLLAVSLTGEFRFDHRRGVLYMTAMFLAPAAVIAASGFEYVYPRHFLVPMLFGYVAVGCQMARWWQRGRLGQAAVTLLLTAFVGCNAVPVVRLMAYGRNQDAATFTWLVEHAEGTKPSVSGDHDFRVGSSLNYFSLRNQVYLKQSHKELDYFTHESLPPEGTEWMLLQSASEWDTPRPPHIANSQGNIYELRKVFLSTSLSGFTWWIYQRSEQSAL